jgi:hypothetical protein
MFTLALGKRLQYGALQQTPFDHAKRRTWCGDRGFLQDLQKFRAFPFLRWWRSVAVPGLVGLDRRES